MNTYERIAEAIGKFAYKSGQYKGDAPADPSRRARNHIRLVKRGENMAVTMYNTDILTAYPDGRIQISVGGWHTSATTRDALNSALGAYRGALLPHRLYMHSVNVFGRRQTGFAIGERTYRVQSDTRLVFSESGELLSTPSTFSAKRVDTSETKAFRDDIKESGFLAMYPLLYATATPDYDARIAPTAHRMAELLTDEDQAHRWGELVACFKYTYSWAYGIGTSSTRTVKEAGDAKSCWAAMMAHIRSAMYGIVDSDTTVLINGVKPKFSPVVRSSVSSV